MIEKLAGPDPGTLGIRLSGTLSAGDYERFVTYMRAEGARNPHLRLLALFESFKGWNPNGPWARAAAGATYGDPVERLALVGDRRLEPWLAHWARPFRRAEIATFPPERLPEAWLWAASDVESGTGPTPEPAPEFATEPPPEPVPVQRPEAEPDCAEQVAEIERLESRSADLENRILGLQADFKNQRRRTEREIEDGRSFALQGFVEDLLPVRDSLERSVAAEAESTGESAGQEGVRLTLQMWDGVMARHGVEEIDPVGQQFDPEFQEALSTRDEPGTARDTVLEVVQKGYLLNGRVVRPARVIVAG